MYSDMEISQIRTCYFGAAKNRIAISEPNVQGEGNKINHRHCAKQKAKSATQKVKSSVCWSSVSIIYL